MINNKLPSKNQLTTAWPASWTATVLLSASISYLLTSKPAMTLSAAISKSIGWTISFPFLAAIIAASLHKLAISAPLNPGVKLANLLL